METLEKKQLKFLNVSKEDVVNSKTEKAERTITLKRALTLGNLEHGKVCILFMDNDGFKKVEFEA